MTNVSQLSGLDFTRLLQKKDSPLQATRERIGARMSRLTPITVEERFAAFERIAYHPHGMFIPYDLALQKEVRASMARVSAIEDYTERTREYFAIQRDGERLERSGVAGRWTGQQAVARSMAKFRLVAWGRRGGKSWHASREAMALAISRPRSWVWVAAPTMQLVSRSFDMIVKAVKDLGIPIVRLRDSAQSKLLEIGNGSRFEGVSLEESSDPAGAAVDFVVIDEAAKIKNSDTWERDILPVIADRDGQVLMISSWEGEGDFFHTQAIRAQSEGNRDWEVFTAPTWDNFFEFPQGRRSEKIQIQERNMNPLNFLEEFGAVPAKQRNIVYPEFKERVHVGDHPYDPARPVILSVDPSGGANPYAVLAIQDYGDHFTIIDEFYEVGVIVENIVPILRQKSYFSAITDVIVDSAAGPDILRLCTAGLPAYPVFEKPEIWQSIPYVKRQMRDPHAFYGFYRTKVNQALEMMGLDLDTDRDLSEDQQQMLAMQVEEMLSDNALTPDDIQALKGCARMLVDRRCVSTITELKFYRYPRAVGRNGVIRENPEKKADHACDAIRYFTHMYKRFDELDPSPPTSYLYSAQAAWEETEDEKVAGANRRTLIRIPGTGFLRFMRDYHSGQQAVGVSYLHEGE